MFIFKRLIKGKNSLFYEKIRENWVYNVQKITWSFDYLGLLLKKYSLISK